MPEVKKIEERMGNRVSYARMEINTWQNGLTESEIEFIILRDSFYIAYGGEIGYLKGDVVILS